MSNIVKETKLSQHGNYIYANLDGIDFVASGVMVDRNTQQKSNYGASVKLKFIIKDVFYKEVNGMKIPTTKANTVIIRIPTEDDKLPALVKKYNEMLGNDLLIKYNLTDGQSVSVQDEEDILPIK